MWPKFPLNQSCSLKPAASGFNTSKNSRWEICLFATTVLLLDLTFTWSLSWILPACSRKPPSVPPVRQDFVSTEKSRWHKIHGVESDDRTEVYEQEGPTYIKEFGYPVVRGCKTLLCRDLVYIDFNYGFIGLWFVHIWWVMEVCKSKKLFNFLTHYKRLCPT